MAAYRQPFGRSCIAAKRAFRLSFGRQGLRSPRGSPCTVADSWVGALARSLLAQMPDQKIIVGSGQDGNQDGARHGACVWRRPFHGLERCSLGRLCGGVVYPLDCGRIPEQGSAAVIRDPCGECGGHHPHCPVLAGSLAVPDRHEHLYRLLRLHDAGYFPMVFLVGCRVLGTAHCTFRQRRPCERFSDSYNSYRGNRAGYVELQPGLALDLADQ